MQGARLSQNSMASCMLFPLVRYSFPAFSKVHILQDVHKCPVFWGLPLPPCGVSSLLTHRILLCGLEEPVHSDITMHSAKGNRRR